MKIIFNKKFILYMNTTYLKYQSFKITQYHHKKMIQKIMLEQFPLYFLI
jgi:hypothetical protein